MTEPDFPLESCLLVWDLLHNLKPVTTLCPKSFRIVLVLNNAD